MVLISKPGVDAATNSEASAIVNARGNSGPSLRTGQRSCVSLQSSRPSRCAHRFTRRGDHSCLLW